MPRQLNSVSAIPAFTVLLLSLMTVSGVAAQTLTAVSNVPAPTQQCSDLMTVTGKADWMLVSGPGISTPKVPVTVGPYPGWKNPPLPGSSWVSIDANHGRVPGAPGDYTYEFNFCLCRDGRHALSLSFYADNGAEVFLNNTSIYTTNGISNFTGAVQVVNYVWAGGPGTNKVRIVVHNDGGPTGLDAVLRITGATPGTCCIGLSTTTGQPGWTLASSPGVNVPKAPVTVSPYPGWKNPPLPGSSWISIDANRGHLPGNYTYDFPFCICKDGKHALSLSFYADNGAKVYLNSTLIFSTNGIFNFTGAPKVVNYSWAGGPGQNTLRIVVNNQGSVTGLDAALSITGANAGRCQTKIGPALEQDQNMQNIEARPSAPRR